MNVWSAWFYGIQGYSPNYDPYDLSLGRGLVL